MRYTNFQAIPERLKAYYCIDVDFRDLEHIIDRYIESHGLELNPDFQRGHVWTEEQQIAYVEYLLTRPDRDKSIQIVFNKPGWMMNIAADGNMVCVDGLQRVTACLRFLHNEIPAYGTYYKDYTGWVPGGLQFIVGAFTKKADVLKWYLEMNNKGTPHTDEEIARVQKMLEDEQNDSNN